MTRRTKRKQSKESGSDDNSQRTESPKIPKKKSKGKVTPSLATKSPNSKQKTVELKNPEKGSDRDQIDSQASETASQPSLNNNAVVDVLEPGEITAFSPSKKDRSRSRSKNNKSELQMTKPSLQSVKKKLEFEQQLTTPKKLKTLNKELSQSKISDNEAEIDGQSEEESTTDDGENSDVSDRESEIEMEISFEASGDDFTDEDQSSTDDEEDKERGLNRRIAIANIGRKETVDQNCSTRQKSPKNKSNVPQGQLEDWIKEMISKQIAQQKQDHEIDTCKADRKLTKKKKKEKKEADRVKRRSKYSKNDKKRGGKSDKANVPIQPVKSHSDSTFYTPGLNMAQRAPTVLEPAKSPTILTPQLKADITSQVAQILNAFKLTNTVSEKKRSDRRSDDSDGDRSRDTRGPIEAVEDEIIQAERQKADLIVPKGKEVNNDDIKGAPKVDHGAVLRDGDYFDLNSCLDSVALGKIAKGGFLDIDKLYSKRKQLKSADEEHDKKYQWVQKDGESYWQEIIDREAKVNNFKKWEMAFRVYAQAYAAANPHRGAEIWQYVDTIQDAANNFQWENVARYDYNFRKLMELRPERCWATINTQMWTKCMRHPFVSIGNANGSKQQGQQGGGSKRPDGKKESACWKYNRNRCNRSAADCRYKHKCSYCGSYNHIGLNCLKRKKDQQQKDQKDRDDHCGSNRS